MTATKTEQADAIEQLNKYLEPGDTVWTTLKHVSRSGMYRVIDLYVIKDNEPLRLSYSAGMLCEGYDRRHEGARASGVGMDMGFSLVYDLSYRLWPAGVPCVGKKCQSNDHRNGDAQPAGTCKQEACTNIYHGLTVAPDYRAAQCTPWIHQDGGYALKQRWL